MRHETITIEQYFQLYVSRLQMQRKYATARNYISSWNSFSAFLKGDPLAMHQLVPAQVQAYNRYLKLQGLSANSISFYNRFLRSAWRKARKEGYVPAGTADPFASVGMERWNRMLCAFLKGRLGVETPLYRNRKAVSFAPLEKVVRLGGDFGHYTARRQKALQKKPFRRKLDTARLFLARLPLGLCYGAREYLAYLWVLTRGNT